MLNRTTRIRSWRLSRLRAVVTVLTVAAVACIVAVLPAGGVSGRAAAATTGRATATPVTTAYARNVYRGVHRGRTVTRVAFTVVRTAGANAAPENLAVAYAHCRRCRTVAVSVQIVLAPHAVDSIKPSNRALAVNVHCSRCHTVALAYQFVIADPGRIWLNRGGHRALADVERRVTALVRSGAATSRLDRRGAVLAERVQRILSARVRFSSQVATS